MEKSIFDGLREKWIAQRNSYQMWEQHLTRSAHNLKQRFSEKLGLKDKTWDDFESKSKTPYVQLSNLKLTKNSAIKFADGDLINNRGELIFGILLTLDHGETLFPKQHYRFPIAAKSIENIIHYAFYDTEADSILDDKWQSDIDTFVNEMIEKIETQFSFDPSVGIPPKPGIGFL